MASGSSGRDAVGGGLPEELDAWIRQRADDLGVPREELLAQLVGSYRLAVESDVDATPGTDAAAAGLDDRIDALEAEVDEKIDEIRKRVVQLKDEIDRAGDADHDHEAFERVEALAGEIERLDGETERLDAAVASLREADEDHAAAVADLDEKLTTVASAVVNLREADGNGSAGAAEPRRAALAELKRRAGEIGVDTADCDACGNEVNLALLTEPACPHCETELRDVTASSGLLFGSATVGHAGDDGGNGHDAPGGSP